MSGRAWIEELEDGRTQYLFHQSWLGDTDLCLERARLGLLKELPEQETDSTAVGTAVHLAIECAVDFYMEYGEWMDTITMYDIAEAEFMRLTELPHFEWVKRQMVGSLTYIGNAIRIWGDQVRPRLDPMHTELTVGPHVLFQDDERVVMLRGSIDYVDRTMGLCDWKTGSAFSWKGKGWEKERWAIQPTAYTWLWHKHLGVSELDDMADDGGPGVPFTYFVMRDDGQLQELTVRRWFDDWAWLRKKVRGIVSQIESGTDRSWPMNDTHALCSPKYCPAWGDCKGLYARSTWPR